MNCNQRRCNISRNGFSRKRKISGYCSSDIFNPSCSPISINQLTSDVFYLDLQLLLLLLTVAKLFCALLLSIYVRRLAGRSLPIMHSWFLRVKKGVWFKETHFVSCLSYASVIYLINTIMELVTTKRHQGTAGGTIHGTVRCSSL